jgi:carbamoyltransferase
MDNIDVFTHVISFPHPRTYGDRFDEIDRTIFKTGKASYHEPGHHLSHASNAFFSSNFNKALIISVDSGGWDFDNNGSPFITYTAVYRGEGTKIDPIQLFTEGGSKKLNIGCIWHFILPEVFGLSSGPHIGNQAGSLMAMAAVGDNSPYTDLFIDSFYGKVKIEDYYEAMRRKIAGNDKEKYNIAKSLQLATEVTLKNLIGEYLKPDDEYLCMAGGVALNSVAIGKIQDWYPQIKEVYIPPIPYDAGLTLGAAQFIYHHHMDNPRIKWDDNFTPYLGVTYEESEVRNAIQKASVIEQKADDEEVVKMLIENKIVSIFNHRSESGRRALGNRSIIAGPQDLKMKDLINEKVKHRQWFRPFAPSILQEETKNWFKRDVNSPYMSHVIQFKDEVKQRVPAVVHFDGTGRLQTVTEKDNAWYYGFIKQWYQQTGIPMVLNTSFNDREPIVEEPSHAIHCFMKTQIDALYFPEFKIILKK